MPLRVHHISVKLDKRFVVTLTIWEEWLFCCHIWTSASHLCKMRYVEPYFAYHVWSIQGRVSIDLHMLTTWICLQGLLLPPFILATSKAFGTWVKLNVTPSVTRHLTTKCDKRYTIVKVLWVKAKAKKNIQLIWISELHTSFHLVSLDLDAVLLFTFSSSEWKYKKMSRSLLKFSLVVVAG